MVSARTASQTSVSAPEVRQVFLPHLPIFLPSCGEVSFYVSHDANTFPPEFAQGKVDPVEAGKQGGHTGGSSTSDDNSSGSSGGKGQFAGGKVDPVEAGKKGGKSSN
jgi:hypothetical protein